MIADCRSRMVALLSVSAFDLLSIDCLTDFADLYHIYSCISFVVKIHHQAPLSFRQWDLANTVLILPHLQKFFDKICRHSIIKK